MARFKPTYKVGTLLIDKQTQDMHEITAVYKYKNGLDRYGIYTVINRTHEHIWHAQQLTARQITEQFVSGEAVQVLYASTQDAKKV